MPFERWTARHSRMPWLSLAVASIALAACAKAYLISCGPDLEPDAYGHALAARRMLHDPTDLAAHWVWLPLGHVVSACFIALGGGMDGVRWMNAVLTSALPIWLAAALARDASDPLARPLWRLSLPRCSHSCVPARVTGRDERLKIALAWTAASLVALSPIGLATGETGALEPLFLTLIGALSLAVRSPRVAIAGGLAGLLASCAALLRYEGWMLPPVLFLGWWRGGRGVGRAVAWVAPALTIATYVVARTYVERSALSFVRENDDFARTFYAEGASRWPIAPHAAWMSIWYSLVVPAIELGPLVPFALAGAPWLVRRGPRPLTAALFAVLAFLTVTFVAKKHMGLLRHALSLTPLYATAAAAGLVAAARAAHRRSGRPAADLERWAFMFAAPAVLCLAACRTLPTFVARAARHETTHRDDLAIARSLRAEWGPGALVHCDVTAVETLSNVPPSAFVRWQLPETPRDNLELERSGGHDVLVVSTPARVVHLRDALRPIDAAGELVLFRYAPDPGRIAEDAPHFPAPARPREPGGRPVSAPSPHDGFGL